MDDLHVNSHLAAVVSDDEDADGATARLESLLEAVPERRLVNDGEVLLDITGLGHGDDGAILHVKDAVLLEDGAEHGLDNDAGGGVGDEAGLLMELLGEEVNTEVAVLAGGSRGADADDLAGAALEDQDVTEADVVAGDGDGVGSLLNGRGGSGAAADGRDLSLDVAVLIVVTHVVGGGGGNGGRRVGLVVQELYLLLRGGNARGAGEVDGGVGDLEMRFLLGGTGDSSLDSELVTDGSAGLEDRATGGKVDGGVVAGGGYNGGFLAVVGLGAGAEFTLSKVDDGAVRTVAVVEFDARLEVVGGGRGWLRSADLLVEMVLFLLDDGDGDGTAVLFLLAGDADLLFEAVLLDDLGGRGGRESGLGGERRVLTYPSSWGNLDLDLLVGFGLGSGLGLPVGRREDAERDRDAGFKVQVAGLLGARNNLLDVRQEDISC